MGHKKYRVAAHVIYLADEKSEDIIKLAVIQAVLKGHSIAEGVVDALLRSVGIKAERAFKYARDESVRGIPTHTTQDFNANEAAVADIIEGLEADNIALVFVDIEFLFTEQYAKQYLHDIRNYNVDTEIVGNPPFTSELGEPVYLLSQHIEFEELFINDPDYDDPDNEDLIVEGEPPTPDTIYYVYEYEGQCVDGAGDPTYEDGEVEADNGSGGQVLDNQGNVTYEVYYAPILDEFGDPVLDGLGNPTYETEPAYPPAKIDKTFEETVEFIEGDPNNLAYNVIYQLADVNGDPVGPHKYWTYLIASHDYPELDISENILNDTNEYYPIVPIREHQVSWNHPARIDTPTYDDGVRIMDLLGLDYPSIIDDVNSNPNVGAIDNAYFGLGVNLDGQGKSTIRYLYHYLIYLESISASNKQDFDNWIIYHASGGNAQPAQGKLTRSRPPRNVFNITDGYEKYRISYNYVDIEDITGVIGTVGHYDSNIIFGEEDHIEYNLDGEHLERILRRDILRVRKQINETTYRQVSLSGPDHTNYALQNRTITVGLGSANNDGDNRFIIPLNHTIVRALPLAHESMLITESMKLVVTSFQKRKKKKWYQKGIFKVFLFVITIAISIIFTPAGGAAFASLVAATGSTVLALVVYAAITAVINFALEVAFSFIVEKLGLENSLIIAAILVVVSLGSTLTSSLALVAKSTAQYMLMAVSGFTQAITTQAAEIVQDLSEEYAIFEETADKKLAEIEEMQDLLDMQGLLTPMAFLETIQYFIPNETPNSFYKRTIHAGNIGVMALKVPENYVDMALKLPDIHDSIPMIQDSDDMFILGQ